MLRLIAVLAFILAIVLFVVVAIGNPSNGGTIEQWAFAAGFAGLLALALEDVVVPRGPSTPA